jgi:hypothetical protein
MAEAVCVNKNGGFYHRGRMYDYATKLRVGGLFLDLMEEATVAEPSITQLAKEAKVSWDYAAKVVDELKTNGNIISPSTLKLKKNTRVGIGSVVRLTIAEEEYLLGLRADAPNRPNLDYVSSLHQRFGKMVSSSFLTKWFKFRFEFPGSFKKPNLVPLDKFRVQNVARYVQFREQIGLFDSPDRFHFMDEKHLVNSDIYPTRVRANPLTGRVDCVQVSGDFRSTFNLHCIISANPTKPYPLEYLLGTDNGCSASMMAFVEYLLTRRWFNRGDVIVMDNARIHTGGEADILSDLLWEMDYGDGVPLHVVVVYLPTRSPELNPIELVFHILSERIRSFRYFGGAGPADMNVLARAAIILNAIDTATVLSCCAHCGYH